ncbi:hypothetical protein EJ110_NYTH44546 [Nymphaea thermarum]|nr:hypothetical protein EJ110_NYTH44546 [Nymphaea thermarum]
MTYGPSQFGAPFLRGRPLRTSEGFSIVAGAFAGLVGPQAQLGLLRMGESEGEGVPMLLGDVGDQVCEGEALPSLASSSKEKSWAAVVNGERPAAEINMPPLEKKEVAGIKRLVISQQSYELLCQPFKFSAITTFAGRAGKGRLDYSFIFTSLRSIWPGVAHLRFTSVGKGMFLICTSSENDLKFILSPGRWYVGGRLLIANQWHPGHVDGSCHFTEASKEGAKVAPNAWHLVKVPKRRPPLNKIKENLQLKQNKFEALSQLLEEKADGVRSHDERQYASPAEKGQDNNEFVATHNVHASINQVSHVSQNGKAEGLNPKPCYPPKPISIGIDPNPLDGYSMDKPAEKAKKRSLKHREKFQFKFPDRQLVSNIDLAGPWARIIAMWDLVEVTLQNWYAHSHWMFLKFLNTASAQSFVAVGVYLHTDFRIRKDQFLSLCSALNQCNAPVICMGDFNAVLTSNEKTRRAPALQACLALSNFVQQSALHEVSCPDMKFTWTNNRVGHENIMSKIDRCYVSKKWVDDPDNLVHLEDMVGYVDQVQSAWTVDVRGCTMIKPIHKLEATRDKLRVWCKGGANDLPHQIRVIERKIKNLQVISESGQLEAIDEECYLKHDLSRLLWLEERRDGVLPQSLAWGPTVSPEENVDLLKPVSDSEITWAVMKADKDSTGPGPV